MHAVQLATLHSQEYGQIKLQYSQNFTHKNLTKHNRTQMNKNVIYILLPFIYQYNACSEGATFFLVSINNSGFDRLFFKTS